MDDPLAVIYENSMLRSFGAALALGAAPLAAAKDSIEDYKKQAVQTAEYIKTFDKQIEFGEKVKFKLELDTELDNAYNFYLVNKDSYTQNLTKIADNKQHYTEVTCISPNIIAGKFENTSNYNNDNWSQNIPNLIPLFPIC
jgi:hypothetical protein